MNTITEKTPPLYIFVDESGDMDFSAQGSKHYMFTFLVKQRPFKLHEASANLQIVDYISWAIFRKYERSDDSYYQKIRHYLIDEEVMTKDRKENHY